MRRTRAARLFTAWIAMAAILLATLAPSLSHALSARHGAEWIEVCTSAGSRWIQADAAAADHAPASDLAHPLEHCPLCSLHADALALPATPPGWMPAPMSPHPLPPAFLAAPRTLHAWVRAQPRAPPLFS